MMVKMRGFRKLLALMLCVAMVLAGCGSDTPDNQSNGQTGVTGQADNQEANGQNGSQGTSDDRSGEDQTTPSPTPEINPEAKVVTLDFEHTHQTMDGFGAAYTWYGDRLLKSKDPEGGLDALFSDAKLTILRFKNEYGYRVPNKASNASAMAQNYKEARDRAAQYGERVYVLMCCWSPPAYLKSDNTIDTGYGTLAKNDTGEFMYEEYAQWWVESLKYYMSRGIVIDYLSIQNEIDFSPETYEGCVFAPKESENRASYAKAFLAVYRAIKKEFGDKAPKMIGPETMSCASSTLFSYLNDILKEEPEALAGVGYHLYVGGTSDGDANTVRPSSYMTNFSSLADTYPDIRRWQTEFYIGKGIQTAELFYYALCYADMTAYLYWSGVWADLNPGVFESADLVEINDQGEWRLTANYYAMRHYSQFIRPGYTRIETATDAGGIRVSAFTSPYKDKLAIVAVNNTDKEVTIRFETGDYVITGSKMYRSIFGDDCKDDSELFKETGALDNYQGVVIPAKSVISFDLDGYPGEPVDVPAVTPIVYEDDVIIEDPEGEVPDEDVVVISAAFDTEDDRTRFSGMGSSRGKWIADGDGGYLAVVDRSDTWNGIAVSNEYFDHYGYLMYVKYDCMMENGGHISLTPTFGCNGGTFYPSGENDRVVCENMEPGKWYHVEGYMTLYSNMEKGSYRMYWEAPEGTDDFYLDNVEVKILYTQPAGEFAGE